MMQMTGYPIRVVGDDLVPILGLDYESKVFLYAVAAGAPVVANRFVAVIGIVQDDALVVGDL